MAVSAYVLIQTEVGKAAQVADEVGRIDGVVSAEDVTGPYDVIVRAEASSVDDLGKMVVSRVQLIDGTGRVLLDYLNGRMPGYVDTAMNVAHVDDLAAGHLLVLESGRRGRSYIIGGENMSMRSLLDTASACTGLRAPRTRWPGVVGLGVGVASEFIEGTASLPASLLVRIEPPAEMTKALTQTMYPSYRLPCSATVLPVLMAASII